MDCFRVFEHLGELIYGNLQQMSHLIIFVPTMLEIFEKFFKNMLFPLISPHFGSRRLNAVHI